MNWYKHANNLSQTLSVMPQSTRMSVVPLLNSLGFDDDGKEKKSKPLTDKEKKDRQEAHERFREREYDHMPA